MAYNLNWNGITLDVDTGTNLNDKLNDSFGKSEIALNDLDTRTTSNTSRLDSNGLTSARPTVIQIGYFYFDTDLNIPIWWNGTIWVNATGVGV